MLKFGKVLHSCAMVLVAASLFTGAAQGQNIVFDANILFDNDSGSYTADAGGSGCPHGVIDVANLATVQFDNQTTNPMLSDPYNLTAPDWSPLVGSPVLAGNPNYRQVDIASVDSFFDEVCFTGAADAADRWWDGWTYFNQSNGAGRTDIVLGGDIDVFSVQSDTTWTTGSRIRLNGRVDVQAGATLTVEPGVTVVGGIVGSYLVVERDADLNVLGTPSAPVIFTSSANPGSQFPGDWSGVVIHGKAVANCADTDGCGLTTIFGDCESEGGAGFFGGSDDADNSGTIKFARVEYAGQEIAPNNELNAWTFNAVGSGTTIHHLQAHYGTDDNFEWFGGTMQAKYLVSTSGDDDNFDWQMGWRGKLQFAVCQQAGGALTPNADSGIEADNNENDDDCPGRSNPTISHLTLVGTGPNSGADFGMRLRRGTAFTVVNSVIQGFNFGLRVEGPSLDNCAGAAIADLDACPANDVCDSLMFDANLLWDNDTANYRTHADGGSGGAGCWHGAIDDSTLAEGIFSSRSDLDPMLSDPYNLGAPDWSPALNSPALPGHPDNRVVKVSDLDTWFEDVCYQGAAGYQDNWWDGWTYFNYANGTGRSDIVLGGDIDVFSVHSDTTWTTGSRIRLNGRVDVQAGATLTIEEGVTVVGGIVGSYLVVERDADIDVQGTAAAPVIFTSSAAPGSQFPGDWSGVVIHGKAVANCADTDGCGLTSVFGDCESEGGAGFFGGSDDHDNSGSIRYARVEYAGQEIAPNNELNAWTFNAVGDGTVVEYLQAHFGTDDNFEWFGGTVKAKYLVSTAGDDDNIDWQMGFRGRIQFAVCQQAGGATTPNADSGIEADNNENDDDCEGRSCPILSNLTLIGTGPNPGADFGIRLRRGTAGVIVNSIIQGFNYGLRIETPSLDICASQVTLPDINCGDVTLGVGDGRTLPAKFVALAAPNPMSKQTSIRFSLPADSEVTVRIFDVNGRLVESLDQGVMTQGDREVNWNTNQASGTYFYQVVADHGIATGKLVVVNN